MKAIDFDLPGVDGARHSLASARGPKGLVLMFICNHCPYVKAVIEQIVRDCRELAAQGVGSIAVMFPFPYVIDETQEVARAYGAACTPDFFGFDANLDLRYRGRLDASRREAAPGARRELYEAMLQVAQTGAAPKEQVASIGCSIKWKR